MNYPEIKPCPFCGQPPRLRAGKVKCVNDECKVMPGIKSWYCKGYDKNAIDDWNYRHFEEYGDISGADYQD